MATATEAPATTAEGLTQHTPEQLAALIGRLESLLEQSEQNSGLHGWTRAEQIAALHKLREPFDQREVRYRPQPWCKKCSNAQGWPKVCEHHKEIKCQRCNGQKITEAHICLKYIGHAEATNRLLNVDPFWGWEPLALDQVGLPQYDGNRGMWIKLTVCGVTRIGYGDAAGKDGANAVKEIIGDAIRNAGMRFGMALNLWTSSDLQILEPGVELTPELAAELGGGGTQQRAEQAAPQRPRAAASAPEGSPLEALMEKVRASWGNALSMEQNLREGEKHGASVLEVNVPSKDGPVPFGDLMRNRIAELKQAAAERNAA